MFASVCRIAAALAMLGSALRESLSPSFFLRLHRLRQTRKEAGLPSAQKAAARYGLNKSTYASHENGQTPVPQEAAIDYAKAFRVSAAWILTGEVSKKGEDFQLSQINRKID